MIGFLHGTVIGPDLLRVGDVGYQVHCPAALNAGDVVDLHTRMVVRENDITLYGFDSQAGRCLFDALTAVSGVGPKIALAALAANTTEQLVKILLEKDVDALAKTKGLGKATAAKLAASVNVPAHLKALAEDAAPSLPPVTADPLVEALVQLGRSKDQAAAAIAAARSALGDDASDAEIIRGALRAA